MLLRELNKARVGFDHQYPSKGAAVATGNWGCGAFGGDIHLKSMLQWCAATVSGRGVQYFTFRDRNCKGLSEIVKLVTDTAISVGGLIQLILDYSDIRLKEDTDKLIQLGFDKLPTLFQFIEKKIRMLKS